MSAPQIVKDYVFDLHEAVKMSQKSDDIHNLYDVKFKDITDKLYAQSPWPDASVVASECRNDADFLCFYREMAYRHLFAWNKKVTVFDMNAAYLNYVQLFEYILRVADVDDSLSLTAPWINDIIQEFVYQFQGFCQFRSQVQKRSINELAQLDAHKGAWAVSKVVGLLYKLAASGASATSSAITRQFSVFASIELVRLECLIGDYTSSMAQAKIIFETDVSALLVQAPLCHVNLYYHAGLSHLMLREHVSAIEIFSEIILHIHRVLRNNRLHLSQVLKILDKVLVLTAIASALSPGVKLDDQVRELVQNKGSNRPDDQRREAVEGKWTEKLRRLGEGDIVIFTELFEQNCPKFICPTVPDYSLAAADYNIEAFNNQVSIFMSEVHQYGDVLKIRSYLKMYTSIEVSKLARFNNVSEATLLSYLMSYKHKTVQKGVNVSDVKYKLKENSLYIESPNLTRDRDQEIERQFSSGIRKNAEIRSNLSKYFTKYNL